MNTDNLNKLVQCEKISHQKIVEARAEVVKMRQKAKEDAEKEVSGLKENRKLEVEKLEEEGVAWAKQILQHSPMAIRVLKSAFNAELDGQAGIQELAGNATLLYYMSEEAQEGKKAYNEKRKPNFKKFPKLP